MPLNTVYVGRPSKWGNPFKMDATCSREKAIQLYDLWLEDKLSQDPHFLDALKDKDIACWCPLDKPCHADIILLKLGHPGLITEMI